MENKKNKIMTMVFIVSILILVVSTTYAFFAPQQGGTTSTNTTVTSNTTDLLTFTINQDISFTVTQAVFASGGQNQSGQAIATATLTPNNKTGAVTMNYYLYLNLQSNPTVYSSTNTNEDPELMLQVYDGNNQLVTLTGLGTQKTIKGVTGYDITGVSGLKTLLDNHAISASNNTATIENWRVVITLINLDVNQNDNTGKTIAAEIIIQKEALQIHNYIYMYTSESYNNSALNQISNKSVFCPYEINSGFNLCENEIYFNTLSECENYVNSIKYSENSDFSCQQEIRSFNGLSNDYYFNLEAALNKQYNVYCPTDNSLNCYNHYYDTLENCEYNYTCSLNTITRPYYLRYEVSNNKIYNAKSCIFFNNHEFCLEPDYWIGNSQDEIDGSATKNKLQSDMENILGITVDNCESDTDYAECTFGFYSCYVSKESADCGDGLRFCGVSIYEYSPAGCHK